MFALIFINVFCILLMVLPGVFARRKEWLSSNSTTELSHMVLRFVYPCLIFTAIFQRYSMKELIAEWKLPAYSFLVMFVGYLIGVLGGRMLRFASASEKKAFVFQSLMNNYSFLPLPLVLALYGENGVAALLFSTLGAEMALWTFGIFVLTGHQFKAKDLRHLLSPQIGRASCRERV